MSHEEIYNNFKEALFNASKEVKNDVLKMTNEQEKLQHLANYFHEAGHQEALRAVNMACDELGNKVGRPITLEDVLRALEEIHDWVENGFIQVDTCGVFSRLLPEKQEEVKIQWLLGKSSFDQTDETLIALTNLLE